MLEIIAWCAAMAIVIHTGTTYNADVRLVVSLLFWALIAVAVIGCARALGVL